MTTSAPERVALPRSVWVLLYVAPHRIPERWRERAAEEVRSPEWGMRNAAWITLPFAVGLWLAATFMQGSSFAARSGEWALFAVAVFLVNVLTVGHRRRIVLRAIRTGSGPLDLKLKVWYLPLAFGIGALAVALLYLLFET